MFQVYWDKVLAKYGTNFFHYYFYGTFVLTFLMYFGIGGKEI